MANPKHKLVKTNPVLNGPDDEFLTPMEAFKLLKMCRNTVKKYTRLGRFKLYTLEGESPRYVKSQILSAFQSLQIDRNEISM